MMMMGTLHNPAASLRFGAGSFLLLAIAMAIYALCYHRRRRIEETEVWIMLPVERRPSKEVARTLIVNAMRDQLLEKASWWAMLSFTLMGMSLIVRLSA